jgi:hypothetical protein
MTLFAVASSSVVAQDVIRSERVDSAIQRGVDFLWTRQIHDGRWVSPQFERTFPNGLTAISLYALQSAGISPADRRIRQPAFALFNATDVNTVYARSFRILSWCEIDPGFLEKQIEEDVRFMKLDQSKQGGWGYGRLSTAGKGRKWPDNSNSQLALLALDAAADVGVEVNAAVWRRAEQSWLSSQNPDGGWGYPASTDPSTLTSPRTSYGSMTAGGLASLYLLYDRLHLDAERDFNGRFKARCGHDVPETRPIRQSMSSAWHWWDTSFRADAVPAFSPDLTGDIHDAYLSYYLFGAARLGLRSGKKRFGDRVWPDDLAEQLVHTQRPDGSWGSVDRTCFAILALSHLRTPVLINKLAFGAETDWNNDRRDAANLTRWVSREWGRRMTWQVLDLASHPADSGDAPVVLITGHEPPRLSAADRARLRAFVDAGGTILAVACCSREPFVEGARNLFADMFPRLDHGPLPGTHPVWTMHHRLEPEDDCLGFSDGCRTSVFILTNAACCAWHQNLFKTETRRFQLAGNILRYATFEQRPTHRLIPFIQVSRTTPALTLEVARLMHDGDWWVDPGALTQLSTALSTRVGLGVVERDPLRPSDLIDSDVDALFVTGHTFEPPDAAGTARLRRHLIAGKTLIASPCCGSREFDASFRAFAGELLGPDTWRPIPVDDPIKTGAVAPGRGVPLEDLAFRKRHRDTGSALCEHPVLYGVYHEGRWVVIYSPYDLTCALARHACLSCVGYTAPDAQAIMGNVLLYVAGQRGKGR